MLLRAQFLVPDQPIEQRPPPAFSIAFFLHTPDHACLPPNQLAKNRYYIGFGGSSAIGFSKEYLSNPNTAFYSDGYTPDDVAAFPYDCAMSGEITYNG